ncbi:MAG: C1 family peptidase [Bacteroidota bacterium]
MKKLLLLLLLPFFSYSQYGLGLEFDDEGYESIPVKTRSFAFQSEVAQLDSVSLKQYAPEIRNQGGHGTCVGWATAYYAQSIILAKEKEITDKTIITDNAFSPLFLYVNAKKNTDPNCKEGIGIPSALNKMKEIGSPLYKDFSVRCATEIPDSVYQKAKRYRLKEYTKLFGLKEQFRVRIRETRNALMNGNPVLMGMDISNAFISANVVYEPDSLSVGGHAMTIIGYDDNKFGEGAFEIINSWGEDWGNEGFMWIRYKDFAESVRYGFELVFEEVSPEDIIVANTLEAGLELTEFGYPLEVRRKNSGGQGFQTTVYDAEGLGMADYETKKGHEKGTTYRIKTSISQPAYVYVFGADTKRPVNRLFPVNDSISAFVNAKDVYVMIPEKKPDGRQGRIRLDTNDVQSDYTIAIISLEELNMEEIKEKVDAMEGPVTDRFYEVLKDKLIARSDLTLNDATMGFKAEFEKGSAAILALDIRRSDYKEPSDE